MCHDCTQNKACLACMKWMRVCIYVVSVNTYLVYIHINKMRVGVEMLFRMFFTHVFPVSLHTLHTSHTTRQQANKLSCFHGYQSRTIACKYFCMNLLLLGVLCRETALDGMLHAACIQACKLYLQVDVIELQKISIYLTHVFSCASVYSIRAIYSHLLILKLLQNEILRFNLARRKACENSSTKS